MCSLFQYLPDTITIYLEKPFSPCFSSCRSSYLASLADNTHGRSSDLLRQPRPSQSTGSVAYISVPLRRSLQQRDCSGFSPDSLLIGLLFLQTAEPVRTNYIVLSFLLGCFLSLRFYRSISHSRFIFTAPRRAGRSRRPPRSSTRPANR